MSDYLFDDKFISYYPALARRIGVNAAIIAQAIFSLQDPDKKFGRDIDGDRWVYNTYAQWAELTALTPRQVEASMRSLEALGAVISFISDDPKDNRLKFYRVDPEHDIFRGGSPSEGRRVRPSGDGSPPEGRPPITTNLNNSSSNLPAPPLSLADLESKLPPESLDTWRAFKHEVNLARKNKRAKDSVHFKNLSWLLTEAESHHLAPHEINAGLRGCMSARNGPAENGIYFRKAALSSRDDREDGGWNGDLGIVEMDRECVS